MNPQALRWLSAGGPLLGLLLVIGLFSLSDEIRPVFLSGANAKVVLTQTVVVGLGALGMTLIIVSGGIDLSAGSVVALGGVVAARLIERGYPAAGVILLTVLTGGLVGLANGGIIAGLRMLPFIVTLGMMTLVRGLAKWTADNQVVTPPRDPLIDALMAREKAQQFLPLPPGVWITLALALVMIVVLNRTVFGRRIFAIGSNEATARLCGIRVGWNKAAIYALAGLFFGLAGLMQYARLSVGDPSVAVGLELDIIAAVVIGGASLSGGVGSIGGSMIGALMMAVLRNGSSQIGWPTYMQEIIIGLVIVLAVALDKWRQARFAKG